MKKLYYLDESEKERILTLHKKHKENLLTEVEDRETWKKTITDKCDKYATTKPLMSTADLKSIAASLKSNIDSGGATGYASGITEKNINTNLTKIKKTVDFCSLLRIYQERYSEDLLSVLNNEFYNDTNWRDNVKLPILDATEDFNSNITTSTEDKTRKVEKKGWELYDCVIKKGGRELPNGNYRRYSTKLKSNVIYTDGGKFYVETGGSGTWEDYYCEGDIITPKSSQKTDNKQPNTGSGAGGAQSLAGGYIYQNAFTPEKVSAIKTAVGSTDKSGTLTQDDINKLYAKLSQK
jgi:hypothetical protein